MAKVDLSVLLDKEVYQPGQTVSGKVHVNINEEVTVSAIHVSVIGNARVGFLVLDKFYYASEDYIEETQCLLSRDKGLNQVLTQGSREFPFQFKLKENIPSSYESGDGTIRYLVKAKVVMPLGSPICTKMFMLANFLDLNYLPAIEYPAKSEASKNFCCCCCASDPVTASLEIHKKGYVPGETILFNSEITNMSDVPIKETEVTLVMRVEYYAAETKIKEHVLGQLSKRHIQPAQTYKWINGKLKIPAVPPTLANCSIIDISYYVQLRIPELPLEIQANIVIGSIPLRNITSKCDMPPNTPMSLVTSTVGGEGLTISNFRTAFAPVYPYYRRERDEETRRKTVSYFIVTPSTMR